MPTIVLSAMLIVANVMGAGMIVPQVARLHRLKTTDGISGSWIGVGLAMNLWWIGYGWSAGLWGIIPVSATAFVLYAVMTKQFADLSGAGSLGSVFASAVALGAVPVPALILNGWSTAGLVVGLCYAIQFAPAAIEAVRSHLLDGVSPTTWVMAGTEAGIWLIYGITQGDTALVLGGGGGSIMSLLILSQLVRRASQRRALRAAELTLAR